MQGICPLDDLWLIVGMVLDVALYMFFAEWGVSVSQFELKRGRPSSTPIRGRANLLLAVSTLPEPFRTHLSPLFLPFRLSRLHHEPRSSTFRGLFRRFWNQRRGPSGYLRYKCEMESSKRVAFIYQMALDILDRHFHQSDNSSQGLWAMQLTRQRGEMGDSCRWPKEENVPVS